MHLSKCYDLFIQSAILPTNMAVPMSYTPGLMAGNPFGAPASQAAFGQPQAAGFGQVGLISTRILSSIRIVDCHLIFSQCIRYE
jgi:hypothetical protein